MEISGTAGEKYKRERGRYYTEQNPFTQRPFREWAERIKIADHSILEPFAGTNNLVEMLKGVGYCRNYASYDISPPGTGSNVRKRDTITRFPTGHNVCISNPPWLGQYAARRRGISYPDIEYDDLYKHCLELALENCRYVGFIIPATFLQSGLFRDRLDAVVFLNSKMFSETDNPVCLALFGAGYRNTEIYYDSNYVGSLKSLEKHVPPPSTDMGIKFNDKKGRLGLFGVDNTIEPSIRFCRSYEIRNTIKFSSRSITKINLDLSNDSIDELNHDFWEFRKKTYDVFLTPFKGLRRDGRYRRRLDYRMARRFIAKYA